MKRKSLWLGLSFLLVAALVLASCGEAAPGEQEEEEEEEEPVIEAKPGEGMYFRLVTHGAPEPFWLIMEQGMKDAAAELGATAVMDLSEGDLALQQKMFAEAVASRPDGIGLVIADDIAWDKPVADALAAGIPVFGMNNDDTQGAAGNPRLGYIGGDYEKSGYNLAVRVFEKGKEKGIDFANAHVVMPVEMPGAAYGVIFSAGIKRAMEEYGITSYEILDAGYEMTTAEARMTSYLIANPQTTFIICLGSMTTDRLPTAMKAAGLQPGEVITGGRALQAGAMVGFKEGYLTVATDLQQYLQGYLTIYMLYLNAKYGFIVNIDTIESIIDEMDEVEMIEKWAPFNIR